MRRAIACIKKKEKPQKKRVAYNKRLRMKKAEFEWI
jgi:hypothetical protein